MIYLLSALILPFPLLRISAHIKSYTARYYSYPFYTLPFLVLAPLLIGAFIDFDKLSDNFNKEGKWKVNPPRIIIGIILTSLSIVPYMPINGELFTFI